MGDMSGITDMVNGQVQQINKPQPPALRDICTKKPFVRIVAKGHYAHGEIQGETIENAVTPDSLTHRIVTQEDFMRELDPCGHLINDKEYYHDIWRQNTADGPDKGKWYLEEVPRYAFAFQQVILIKHLTHLCGNSIQFELADKNDDENSRKVYNAFKRGWSEKNMETAWFYVAKSVKATGDGAFVGFLDNGKYGWKTFSFLNGDRLYPHYDLKTGRMNVFARTYSNYDENGNVIRRYIDVWDDTYYYRYSANGDSTGKLADKAKNKLKGIFNIGGYSLEYQEPHNFLSIPVAYKRDDWGPCWTFAQETIDNYEMAFSRMAQNDHDFGLPIMYVKGEGSEEVSKEDMSYASKVFFLPSDGEMGFLQKQDASNAYKIELETLEKQIYTQSFTVKPPELKSGDLPGVAIKLLYSPAVEKAMSDAKEYDEFIDKMVDIFQYGYGVESEMRLKFATTNISHYIKPYVHQNDTELTNNLAMQVQNGFLSKQTASEKSTYATPQEWDRILKEKKNEQMMDLLLQQQTLQLDNTPETTDNGNDEEDTNADADTNTLDPSTSEGGGIVTNHGASRSSGNNGDANNISLEGNSTSEKDKDNNNKNSGKVGRPKGSGQYKWDRNGNKISNITGKALSKWDKWNATH